MIIASLGIVNDTVEVLAISVVISLLLHRFKIPAIVGFLITGILVGPGGFAFVIRGEEIEIMAELGVVLLLFTIGLEFSVVNLIKIRKAVLIGGSIQVFLTIAAFAALSYAFGYDYLPSAIMIGFLIALSSTAIVLKVLQTRNEMKTPQGEVILAIMIFQDIIVVPMMLIVPLLGGQDMDITTEIPILLAKFVAVLVFVLLCTRFVIPRLLYFVAQTQSKELFVTTVVVVCFTVAWITSMAELSMALGAFMAGLMIAETDYNYESAGLILPFKEIFTGIFFISVGMLMDMRFLSDHFVSIFLLTALTMGVKAILGILSAWALKIPMSKAIVVGFAISQVGEFSFVLSKSGVEFGILPIEINNYFLAVSIFTIALTPFVMAGSSFLALKWTLQKQSKLQGSIRYTETALDHSGELRDHIVIVGYSLNGKTLARGARKAGIPYIVIDNNAVLVKKLKQAKIPVVFGDAGNEEVLHHAEIQHARVVMVGLHHLFDTKRVVFLAHRMNPKAVIIARVHGLKDVASLKKIGATSIIVDEEEVNVEMFSQAMEQYLLPQGEIMALVHEAMKDTEKVV